MLDRGDTWEMILPLIEFSYNNNYSTTIEMAPYEALYRKKFETPLHQDEVGKTKILGPKIVEEMVATM